jgi:hypothetical protein
VQHEERERQRERERERERDKEKEIEGEREGGGLYCCCIGLAETITDSYLAVGFDNFSNFF